MKIHLILLPFIFFCCVLQVAAQQTAEEEELEISEGRHSLGLVLSHARIGKGRNQEGDKEFLMVPALAIDYNYWISEKWAIGLHTDLLNENFFVETPEGETLERERPVAPALMGLFKPGEHWVFAFGIGREFASSESFTLARFSIEYGVEIRDGWEVLGMISQDIYFEAYNATAFGLGLSRRF